MSSTHVLGQTLNSGKQSDSTQVDWLLQQSASLRNSNADSALYLANQALELSQEIADKARVERAHNQLGILFRYRGNLDQSSKQYLTSLRLCQQMQDSLCMAKAWHNLGVIERKKGAFSKALEYTLLSISQFERAGDSTALGHVYNSLGNIYGVQQNWVKALQYYDLELLIQKSAKNNAGAARSLYNIGIAYYELSDLDMASSAFEQSLELSVELDDRRSIAKSYHSLGIIQKDLGNRKAAKDYFIKAAALQKEMADKEGQLFTLLGLGELEEIEQQWSEARKTFNEALDIALETGLKDEELTAREHLSHILEELGLTAEAIAQLKHATLLKDTLRDESTSMRLLELQEKYETDKKEKENQLLQQENQLKENELEATSQALVLRNGVLGVMLVIFVLGGLLLVNYRKRIRVDKELAEQREELSRQKMLDLVREQELAYMNATLIGQETERNRIAADLHDGLSNMLVTVKLHFENLADQLTDEKPEVLNKYHQATALLDDLCKKARSLAHEMADEQSQFRLQPALEELVAIIEQTGQLKVELAVHGLEKSVGATIENAVFHTLRELIGNCLKHAEAKTFSIQLTQFENELNVMVEDDGKGFDPAAVKENGMGLGSLKSRIEKINGTVMIDSAMGRGTVVNIDIPIEPVVA